MTRQRLGDCCLAMAGLVWLAVLSTTFSWLVPLVVASGLVMLRFGRVATVMAVVLAGLAWWTAANPSLPEGHRRLTAVVAGDPTPVDHGFMIRLRVGGSPAVVFSDRREELAVGDRVMVEGVVGPVDDRGSQTIASARLTRLGQSSWMAMVNRVRQTLLSNVDPGRDPGRALLAGFLVGDTEGLAPAHKEWLRLSGLSHFIAVSGSNVAMFLGLWVLLSGPLAWSPYRRAIWGLLGLGFFAVLTRFEPSVIRASAMAAVVFVGRLIGLPVSGRTALGVAVCVALLVSPELAVSLGFQLSVAATLGLMWGVDLFGLRFRRVSTALSASLSAQLAVAPILLWRFDSVPALAPLTNLVAAPLVAVSTMVGGVGAITGWDWLVGLGAVPARIMIALARGMAAWPQMGWSGYAVEAMAAVAVWRRPAWGPRLSLAALGAVGLLLVPFPARVDLPAVVFLDVGQGDAALVITEEATVLIDGGPDPAALSRALIRHRIDKIDLVVVTHAHADHIDGLEAVFGHVPVGAVWIANDPHHTPSSRWLDRQIAGLPHIRPGVGSRWDLGEVTIEVAGPLRSYADTNDQSIVLVVSGPAGEVLFTGDIQAIAQSELELGEPWVLKVPHHGSDSSDLAWLADHAGRLAVISVGDNDYGHPDPEVVAVLERAGAEVHRTDREGELVVSLD